MKHHWLATQMKRPARFNQNDRQLDREVKHLCTAMNRLPGIVTTGSCAGHGKRPLCIWFWVESIESAGLRALARATCDRYYGMSWKIVLDHGDVQPVHFRLEGATGETAYREAEVLATVIDAHVENKTGGYNILTDRHDPHEHPPLEVPENPWKCAMCGGPLKAPKKPRRRIIQHRCCKSAPKIHVVCDVRCQRCSALHDVIEATGGVVTVLPGGSRT